MNGDVIQKLKIPAIGLLASGLLDALVGFLLLVSGLMRLIGKSQTGSVPTDEARRIGYFAGTFVGYGIGFLSLLLAPVIFYGAMKMMKGEKYGAAKAAAILSLLPLACCFPLSAVFGVWALIVLGKPEVKNFFQNGGFQANFPPSPPQSW